MIQGADIPVMPRGVRLHRDTVRDRWVLLAPERAVTLDDIGHAILSEVDGTRSFEDIVATLAAKYAAPAEQIAGQFKYLTEMYDLHLAQVEPTKVLRIRYREFCSDPVGALELIRARCRMLYDEDIVMTDRPHASDFVFSTHENSKPFFDELWRALEAYGLPPRR